MRNRTLSIACLMAISLIILWLPSPFKDSKSSDGLLFTPSPGITSSPGNNGAAPGDTQLAGDGTASAGASPTGTSLSNAGYAYEKVSLATPDGPVVMHLLEIDLKNAHIGVKPVSSHPTLFGYEYLSVMAGNVDALAAVNSGFSYSNGLPGGMFYSNKVLKTSASGRFPVLFLLDGQAVISDARQNISLKSGDASLGPVYFNYYSTYGGIFIFTPVYGSTDRLDKPHLYAAVENGKVTELKVANGAVDIPGDGFLVSAVGENAEKRLKDFIKAGSALEYNTELKTTEELPGEYLSAYECGSRLIKDGADVCPNFDPWAQGLLTREPRTAVGIKSDGTLVFAVVDGRDGDVSIGATGPELTKLLLDRGVYQAALLDGGASSEMIIDGSIVNSLSAGRERLLSSCFVVFKR